MSIIPGIETAAPERTETSSGSRIAEPLAGLLLEPFQVLVDLVLEPVGELAAGGHVGAAGVGRDRETRRDRDAELRHLGKADPLPPRSSRPPSEGSSKS